MAIVCVHGPLRKLAGGTAEHPVDGATIGDLLRALERDHPALSGWVLDERGLIRRHINVYVNGEDCRILFETKIVSGMLDEIQINRHLNQLREERRVRPPPVVEARYLNSKWTQRF